MKSIISIMALGLLAACGKPTAITPLEPVKVTMSIAPAPKPNPIYLKPVEFIVVTKDTQNKLDGNRVWYAITVGTYENLAFNTQEMLRVIREQKAAINYYEGLYVTPN